MASISLYTQTIPKNDSYFGLKTCERIGSSGKTLFSLVEVVARIVFLVIGGLARAGTLDHFNKVKVFTFKERDRLEDACVDLKKNFINIFYPRSTPPLTAENRENRVRLDDNADIQARLKRELQHARSEMTHSKPKAFKYLTCPQYAIPEEDEYRANCQEVGDYQVGSCSIKGRKAAQQDAFHASLITIRIQGKSFQVHLFGVFDGHGVAGDQSSQFLATHLQEVLIKHLTHFNSGGLSDAGIWNALKITCVELNQNLKVTWSNPGSTATFTIILNEKCWTANVGDSRTILDNNGIAVQLSEDAKPWKGRYRRGIQHRGGYVGYIDPRYGKLMSPRLGAVLSVARAFGNSSLPGVSARPKITVIPFRHNISGKSLILLCDGVTDVASTQQIVQSVHDNPNQSVATQARNIVYSAYQAGSDDNLTALVIRRKAAPK